MCALITPPWDPLRTNSQRRSREYRASSRAVVFCKVGIPTHFRAARPPLPSPPPPARSWQTASTSSSRSKHMLKSWTQKGKNITRISKLSLGSLGKGQSMDAARALPPPHCLHLPKAACRVARAHGLPWRVQLRLDQPPPLTPPPPVSVWMPAPPPCGLRCHRPRLLTPPPPPPHEVAPHRVRRCPPNRH